MAKNSAKQRKRQDQAAPRSQQSKGGRPRKDGPRHPSGKLVQRTPVERAEDVIAQAIAARRRRYGLPKDYDAKDAALGHSLGRLHIAGRLKPGDPLGSWSLLQAALVFAEARRRRDQAYGLRPLKAMQIGEAAGGHDSDDGTEEAYVRRCEAAKARYGIIRSAILSCGQPLALLTMESVILEDRDPVYVLPLRKGLEAVLGVMETEGFMPT